MSEDNRLPRVSVVIPCHNAQDWVGRAIQSVVAQHYPKLELVVIDDGSTDRSLEVIRSFDERFIWETGANHGGCAARNRGLERCSGEFVLFLDADDYIEGDLLRGLAYSAKRLALDLALGISCIEKNGARDQFHFHPVESTRDDLLRLWLTGKYVQTGAQLWSTSFLRAIGGWDRRVARSQDIELVLRSILSGANIGATDSGTAVWCDHSSPFRVGRNHSEAALDSEYDFHIRLLERFSELSLRWTHEMAARFYSIAMEAYLYGHDKVGEDALGQARKLGLRGHIGTVRHKILSSVLGLRHKQHLARIINEAV